MKIVFMGTPEFAVASLDSLYNSEHTVISVVTMPDKPAGRGKLIQQSAVKKYALNHNIPVLQPENLKSQEFADTLKKLQADLFVVVAFRMLPKQIWQIPPKGTINIHTSILPNYRGAAPINYAIINNEPETGLTTFMIDEEIDTGKIIEQKKIPILETDNAGTLHDKLMSLSKDIILTTCNIIESQKTEFVSQDSLINKNNNPKIAPKIFKADTKLSPLHNVEKAYNLIRGLSPYPAAFIELISPNGNIFSLKIYESKKNQKKSISGTIETDGKGYLSLNFSDGQLFLSDLQLQNKKRMPISDFLRGFSINNDWKWN